MKKSVSAVSFAVQISALCGDKSAVVTVRRDIIRTAIRVAVGGNSTQWMQGAATAATAKGKVAKALTAGFQAIGHIPALFKPQDVVTVSEKATAIDARTDALTEDFFAAFDATMPAEKTEAEKDAAKAEREAAKATAQQEAIEQAIKERGLVPADSLASDGDVFTAALAMVKAGKFGAALLEELQFAVTAQLKLCDASATAAAEKADEAVAKAKRTRKAKESVAA